MPAIKTASWFGKLPANHVKIGISPVVPRNFPAGSYRRLRALEPGPWFNSVAPDEYLRRYNRILDRLQPRIVAADLRDLAGEGRVPVLGKVPVLVCWESATEIEAGSSSVTATSSHSGWKIRFESRSPRSASRAGRLIASPSSASTTSSRRATRRREGPSPRNQPGARSGLGS